MAATHLPIPIAIHPDNSFCHEFRAMPWLTLVLLGAWHGLNPAMGWLFRGARLQQTIPRGSLLGPDPHCRRHALAVGLVVFILFVLGTAVPAGWLQLSGATILLGLGG